MTPLQTRVLVYGIVGIVLALLVTKLAGLW